MSREMVAQAMIVKDEVDDLSKELKAMLGMVAASSITGETLDATELMSKSIGMANASFRTVNHMMSLMVSCVDCLVDIKDDITRLKDEVDDLDTKVGRIPTEKGKKAD